MATAPTGSLPRSFLVLALAALSWLHPAPAGAHECDGLMDSYTTQVHVERLAKMSMEQALAEIESHHACGQLTRLARAIDERYDHRRDLRTAVLMVQTLGDGPVDVDDTRAHNAIKLLAFQVAKLGDAQQEQLLAYAARKLARGEETESLLAMVRGGVPDWVERQIMVSTATAPVTRGPWAPPGGQAIPFYIGNRAHEAIAAYYRNAHKGERVVVNSTPISAVLIELADRGIGPAENVRARAKGDQALRPDIVNLTRGEIFEIKPAGAEIEARALVAKHVATFAKAGVTMSPGNTRRGGVDGVVPAPAGHFVFYAPEPGVIVYRYQRGDYVPVIAPEGEAAPVHALAPAPTAAKEEDPGFWSRMETITGLTGAALGVYLVVSEGSRVLFPPRNLVPVP